MRNLVMIFCLTTGLPGSFLTVAATAQQQPQAPSILSGEVAAIDANGKQMTVKTKDGEMIVGFDEKTEFKRVSPDKPSLKDATPANRSDIGAGDKIAAVVVLSDDKKSVKQTRRVILMTKGDIAKKQTADQERWTTRGISGRVTALDPATGEITVAQRGGMMGERTVTVAANEKTSFRRYAPDSVRYADATASNLSDIKVGDQLRAVGEKSADGARLAAEEVLSGSFRMVVGKIETIDPTKREITVKEAQTNKILTIAVNDNTLLRRFPAEMAQRMAQMQAMRAAGGMMPGAGAPAGQTGQGGMMPRPNQQNPNGAAGQNPAGAGQPGANGMGMMRGAGRGDVDSMLEQMPALNLTELKIGDAVAASSSGSAADNRVTAIKFVAGVEPFLNAPAAPQNAPQNGRPQAAPSINIPGLDGIGAP